MPEFPLETGSQCALWGCLPLGTMVGFQAARLALVLQFPSALRGCCKVMFGNALLCVGKPGPENTREEKLRACTGS